MKKLPRKLVVNRETIRALVSVDLTGVVSGLQPSAANCTDAAVAAAVLVVPFDGEVK